MSATTPKPEEQPPQPAEQPGIVRVADAFSKAIAEGTKTASPLAGEKKPAKPAAPPPKDEIDELLEDESGTKASKNWKRVRETLSGLKKRVEESERLRAELEAKIQARGQAETRPGAAPEPDGLSKKLQQLEMERAEMEAEIRRLTLLSAEEFGGYYKRARDRILALAKQRLPETHQEVFAALTHVPPGPARRRLETQLYEELDESAAADARLLLMEMDKQRLEQEEALSKDKESFEKLTKIRTEREFKERETALKQAEAAAEELAKHAEKFFRAFQSDPADPEHTRRVEQNKMRLRQYVLGQMAPEELALLPVKAMEFELLAEAYTKLREEKEQLEKALGAMKSTQPGAAAGRPVPESEGRGFVDLVLSGKT